jgi:hypothetical protein
MRDEVDLEELGGLAAALTGDRAAAAELVGRTLATRTAQRAADEAALRAVLVQQYLRRPATSPVDAEDPPAGLAEVAGRLATVSARDRAALVLVRLTGLTLGETAGVLDETPTALRRRLDSVEAGLGADSFAVRAVLESLSWRVPDPAEVARARHRAEQSDRRRRGRARLVAVALGLVLLAALAVPTVRIAWPLPARPAGDWAFGLALDLPDGWTELLHVVTPHQEYLQVGDDGQCTVIASLPSAPAPERRTPPDATDATERVWVDGRPLRFAATYEGVGATVWWPYADGGEVSLSCDGVADDRATVLDMAERLRFSTGDHLRLPVALDRAPDGLQVAGGGFEDEWPLVALLSGPTLRQADRNVIVVVNDEPLTAGSRLTVDGTDYTLAVRNRDVRLCRPVETLTLCVRTYAGTDGGAQGRAVSRATELAKEVARHLRLAPDPDDRSTWFDARDALPQ